MCLTLVLLRPYTVDPVIFACFNIGEFLILGLFTKFRIREFSFFSSSVIIIKKIGEILEFTILSASQNSQKFKPREYFQMYSIIIRFQANFRGNKMPIKCTTYLVVDDQFVRVYL